MAEPNEGFIAGGYPPSAFYFKVVFGPVPGVADTSFQEVSGITKEIVTEDIQEGGENRYTLKLPKSLSHGQLELKRGIAPIGSPLLIWCRSVFELGFIVPIVPMPILVYLMDESAAPIRAWSFIDAYPVKWEVESFGSMKNEVAIEKIVLNYAYSIRTI
jgi:phage tail-like protein